MLVLSGEATNTNFIVFGLTRTGLESTIYRTRGDHANHYATDAVLLLNVMCLVEKYEENCIVFTVIRPEIELAKI